MKIQNLLIALIVCVATNSFTQVFTELSSTNFKQIEYGNVDWGDVDNDGDLDFILTGDFMVDDSYLYINDGNNNFTETTLVGVPHIEEGKAKFAEFNGDGYLDIIVSGGIYSLITISTIFLNNQDGSFTMQYGTNFSDSGYGDFDFGDMDNDGDIDILHKNYININHGTVVFERIRFPDIVDFTNTSDVFGDYDNDGDLDFIVTGDDGWPGYVQTMIYENTGENNFVPREDFNLKHIAYGRASWGDFDNDGDLDVLLSGVDGSVGYIHVYKNNGVDGFELFFSEESYDFHNYSLWGDYDNDGWLDFVVSSINGTKVFKNMSNGNDFAEQTNETIMGFEKGVMKFGDCDNDGDLDLLVNADKKTKLYINNSNNANTGPAPPTTLTSDIYADSVVFHWNKGSDANTPANGLSYNVELIRGIDEEIVSPSSSDNGYRKIVKIGNAGLNTFYIIKNLKQGKYRWRVQTIDNGFLASLFTDFNEFYIGEEVPVIAHSPKFPIIPEDSTSFRIYVDNIGQGTLSYTIEKEGSWFQLAETSGTDSTEINLSCSVNNAAYRKGKIFIIPDDPQIPKYTIEVAQKGSPIFTKLSAAQFETLTYSSISWGDYDNDNDLDLMLIGKVNASNNDSKLYINNGDGTFSVDTGFNPIKVKNGYTEWNDYNNDGLMDLLIAGNTETGEELPQTKLYVNTGNGTLTEDENVEFPGIHYGGANFGDYNNDGKPDIFLTGISNNNDFSGLFINTGSGFLADTLNDFPKSKFGGIKWFDYNKDGLLDFLQYGDNQGSNDTYLQENTIGGVFETKSFPWTISASFVDINEDGHTDLFLYSNFYIADESGNFELLKPQQFSKVTEHCWGDYDNDGDLDIVFRTGFPNRFLFFENFDNKSFKQAASIIDDDIKSVYSIQFVDFNNDGRLDLFLVGIDSEGNKFSNLYINNYYRANQKPMPPSLLTDSIYSETVYLSWNQGEDEETCENGLLYNFYMYGENGDTIVNSMSNKETGFLKTIFQGNANKNLHWHVVLEEPGTYYWSVQSIDYSYEGSLFAPIKQFTIAEFLAFKEEMHNLNWEVGNTYPIVWEEAFLPYVKLEYSTDEGNTWEMINDSINADDEELMWNVPVIEPCDCLLKISNTEFGLADTVLIHLIPNIELISPDSGVVIQTNRILPIEWLSINSEYVNLGYRQENDINWNIIKDSIPSIDSTYQWEIPNLEPQNYYVRVADLHYPVSSDSTLISLLPYLKLLYPGEDEELTEGSLYDITWDYAYLDSIRIDYFEVNSMWWDIPITEGINASLQAYPWLVPANMFQSDYIIVLRDLASEASDTSGTFTIVTSLEEHLKYNVFEIFPNPVKDILHLSFNKPYDNVDVQVIDLHGKIVHQSFLTGNLHYAIKFDLIEAGTYLLRIAVDDKFYEKKIIVVE